MLGLLGLLALAGLLVRGLVVGIYAIPSGSMQPQLRPGDYMLVARWPYGWSAPALAGGWRPFGGRLWPASPRRGDVVVIRDGDRNLVKRVIGLPGDRVAMRDGAVVLDGKALPRWRVGDILLPRMAGARCPGGRAEGDDCRHRRYREAMPDGPAHAVLDDGPTPADRMAERRVPAGHLFLLGDDRDDSADSRIAPADGGIGMVPDDRLVGRALVLFWSTDGSTRLRDPAGWPAAVRWDRIGLVVE